jgi:hypothetical protein
MDLHNQDFLNKPKHKLTAHQLYRLIVLVSLLILPFLFYSYINNLRLDMEKDLCEIQKETSNLREEKTNLQVAYSQLLAPQQIEATALAMGLTSSNTEGILVIDDSRAYRSSNLYADLVKSNGEWME